MYVRVGGRESTTPGPGSANTIVGSSCFIQNVFSQRQTTANLLQLNLSGYPGSNDDQPAQFITHFCSEKSEDNYVMVRVRDGALSYLLSVFLIKFRPVSGSLTLGVFPSAICGRISGPANLLD
jgi:hypothetical protein